MMCKLTIFTLGCGLLVPCSDAQVFPLTDSNLAIYGVNEAVEPQLTRDDQTLYERVAPLLRDQPKEAIRLVQAERKPDASPAFFLLVGNLAYQADDLKLAEQELTRAITAMPSFRRAHRTLGLTYIRQSRYKEAGATWLKVITLGGGDAQSYGLLAYAYLSEGKTASALSAYRMARMFAPDSLDFRRGEAQCLLASDQYPEAIALFDELIQEHPAERAYWLYQANAYLALERFEDAAANLEIARELDASDADALFLLGGLYLQLDTPALALDAYRQALELKTPMDEAKALRPLPWLISRGMHAEAESYYASLDKSGIGNPQMRLHRAELDLAQGKNEAARQQLADLIKTNPMNGPALLLLGRAFMDAGDTAESTFYFERALSVPESKQQALVALGRMHVGLGNLDAARGLLRQAQAIDEREDISIFLDQIEAALRP